MVFIKQLKLRIYGDRSGPKILEIDPVILKLSRFPQVQSERERTLIAGLPKLHHAKKLS